MLSLKADSATTFEKLAGSTAITTAIYFWFHPRLKLDEENDCVSGFHLQNIQEICRQHGCKLIVLAIPSVKDCLPWSKTDLCKKYESIFRGINVHCLDTRKYSIRDYHSVDNDHFNGRGDQKCANDLLRILNDEL